MPIHELNLGIFAPAILDEQLTQYKNIAKLNINNNVKKIPIGAFSNFKLLKKVYFEPKSLMSNIPEYTFFGCISLSKINQIPPSIVSIDDYAFANCVNINDITIPESVAYVGNHAFDGWTEQQEIHVYRIYEFSKACKAQIINHGDDFIVKSDDQVDEDDSKGYYIVKAKCGHVGRQHYIPICFPVRATCKKEAASIILQKSRVKRNHKDAILDVRKVNQHDYLEQVEINAGDMYLNVKSRHDQDRIMTDIEGRLVVDPHYMIKKDKRIIPTHKRDVSSDYKRKKIRLRSID
ncbi:MAG: leucine-rich repeat domain-containing protein [Acholeplasmataceae bacterium]|jgi:hypothetical protein|nr:leucine-rich repeat domain-containing protein [Acholeplasmataceae bacterium]